MLFPHIAAIALGSLTVILMIVLASPNIAWLYVALAVVWGSILGCRTLQIIYSLASLRREVPLLQNIAGIVALAIAATLALFIETGTCNRLRQRG